MAVEVHHVTEAEYNASLRKAVNDYYMQAKNDPTMSDEEVFKNTSEMSERYLTAVEEFHQAQMNEMQNAENPQLNTNVEAENNAGNDGEGVDGGSIGDNGGGIGDGGGVE